MKLILSNEEKKRPYLAGITAVILVGIVSIFAVGANTFIFENRLGQVAFLLARVSLSLIPPLVWIGAALIVALWLVVISWIWRS